MGNVMIKNCTITMLKIQLWQIHCREHCLLRPGEQRRFEVDAAHYTIVVEVSDIDDTNWTETVLPIVVFLGGIAGVAVAGGVALAGAGVVGATAAAAALAAGGAGIGAEAVVLARGASLTFDVVKELLKQAQKNHLFLRSFGWYLAGDNVLEVHGGPAIDTRYQRYQGKPLWIKRIQ